MRRFGEDDAVGSHFSQLDSLLSSCIKLHGLEDWPPTSAGPAQGEGGLTGDGPDWGGSEKGRRPFTNTAMMLWLRFCLIAKGTSCLEFCWGPRQQPRSCGSGGPDGRHEGPGLHWSLALESTGAPTSTGHIPQDVCP
ncbi:neurotrophin-7 isoform X1 [Lates japonicus]|uniref:Neurotrophin-7 isoform X1 n=1 Tax=Lates japonicus TaxID=270547 RepID=A0AAD3M215_LATJO|nr:neurotrophin-7 isoform X1 [Lates japonicus]